MKYKKENSLIERREQLQCDIETILEGNLAGLSELEKDRVARMLCDAVIVNFPKNEIA